NSFAWIELLQTNEVLDAVVREQGLVFQPKHSDVRDAMQGFTLADRFAPGDYTVKVNEGARTYTLEAKGVVLETGEVGDSIGRRLGFRWAPTAADLAGEDELEFSILSPRDASRGLLERMKPQMNEEEANFLRIQLTGTDPEQTTATLNAILDRFITLAADLKRRKLTETAEILGEQLATTEGQLRAAESELQSFRAQTITQPNENTPVSAGVQLTQPTVIGRYFDDKYTLEELQRQRRDLEQVVARAQSGGLAVDQFQQIEAVKSSPQLASALAELVTAEAELRTLLQRYTPQAKQVQDVQARVNTLRSQTVPSLANAVIAGLRDQERDLGGRISATSRDLVQMPARTIREEQLLRERDQAAILYNDVATRHHAARLAEASAIPDVSVLDSALVPQRPTTNTAPRIILMAFMASLGLALGIAILLDQIDRRFRYPDQVTRELGLSILGAIPAIRHMRAGERDPDEAAQVVEAFRSVRLNLVHSYGTAGPVMVTISSPGPGDGKSLVSSNLALSFAEAGYKTLLIDGDIRRGELHRMFGAERRPGLLDHLSGEVALEAVLRPTTHANLTLVPCGTRHQHGPELLGSRAMRELVADLKQRYNVIIIDSPPLGAGIDPFVLGTATGNIMLVLRSGETDRQMAEAKLRLLDRLPVRVLGAVLNDIQTKGVYKYYAYIYGYTAEE
ncbi:MAG: polysaccharide biosynthesis tyrosine autokinase, partial [Gemmatimonadota bacterium]|nr:polysaccharide biosynthesis tyrosine autokinase [Gemmatimonadota bacterium]